MVKCDKTILPFFAHCYTTVAIYRVFGAVFVEAPTFDLVINFVQGMINKAMRSKSAAGNLVF